MISAGKFPWIPRPRWSGLSPIRFMAAIAALLVVAIAGCETVGDGGVASVDVYGDYSSVDYPGPWFGEGVVYANPPYDRGYRAPEREYRAPERGYQAPEHGRAAPEPARARAGGGGGRAIPSIPNQARPSPSPARGGGGGAGRGGGGGERKRN